MVIKVTNKLRLTVQQKLTDQSMVRKYTHLLYITNQLSH